MRIPLWMKRVLLWAAMVLLMLGYGLAVSVLLPNLSPMRVFVLFWDTLGILIVLGKLFTTLARLTPEALLSQA